jgi:hypothetical protein
MMAPASARQPNRPCGVSSVGARQYLAVLDSRSRDAGYLGTIEAVLAERPELVHYRVLFESGVPNG